MGDQALNRNYDNMPFNNNNNNNNNINNNNSNNNNNNIYTVYKNKHFNNSDPSCFISEQQEFIELLPTASFLTSEIFPGTTTGNETAVHHQQQQQQQQPKQQQQRHHHHRNYQQQHHHQQQQQQQADISSSCANSEGKDRHSEELIGSESANESNGNDSESKPQSAWLRWSHERRASYKRRVEIMEQRHFQLKNNRLSSPVRKARQESIRFVSPELKNVHLQGVESPIPAWTSNNGATATDDDEAFSSSLYSPAIERTIPSTIAEAAMAASRRKKAATTGAEELDRKLTPAQWKVLTAYWEHKTFKKCRVLGLVLSTVALVTMTVSFLSTHWVTDVDHKHYGLSKFGLWKVCSIEHDNCSSHNLQFDGRRIAVICLASFPIVFDGVSLILILCGMCASNLPKKIYYYHSAGEIHLLCAISCILALVCYVYFIEEATMTLLTSAPLLHPPTTQIPTLSISLGVNFNYKSSENVEPINLLTKINQKIKQLGVSKTTFNSNFIVNNSNNNSLGFGYFTMIASCLLLLGAWLCMCADELLKGLVNCKLRRIKRRQCVTDGQLRQRRHEEQQQQRSHQQQQQHSQQQQLLLQQQMLQDQLNQQQIQLQLLQLSHQQQLINMQQQPLLGNAVTPLQFALPEQQPQQLMQHLVQNNWTNNLKS